jgi:membrane fusion protein, multidrug efflux system
MTKPAKLPPRYRCAATVFLAAATAIGTGIVGMRAPAAQPAPSPSLRQAIPVGTAKAERQDVPVWLHGLGTVQALNAVTVRARVDGTLMMVPVTEGQMVKQGDVIAVIDPRPFKAALDAASAKKTQDEADLANAKQDFARYSALEQRAFASHQQVDTQRALVNRVTAMIAGDDAAIQTAQLNLGYATITAPFDGRVGLRLVDPGNLVHASDTTGIMTLTQVRPISLVFTLPQQYLPAIVEAMAQEKLPVVARSGDDKRELAQGTLLTPDNAIDPATGTIKLKAQFPNQDDRLWPGQFVDAGLLVRTERQVVAVPARAVQHSQDALYVYVVKPDSTVQRQPVEAVDRGTVMVITKGLDVGQELVVDGQSRLENGTLVTATAAAPPATAAQTGG